MRIDVRRIEGLKDSSGSIIGNRTRAKVVKNKVAPPFKEAEFDIMFGTGISKSGELLDLAVKLNIIQKSGAWFSYGDTRLGQGRDNTKLYLEEHPDFAADIEAQVRDHASELFAGRAGRRRGGSLDDAPARAAAEKPAAPAAAPAPAAQAQEAPKTRAKKPSIDIMMEDE